MTIGIDVAGLVLIVLNIALGIRYGLLRRVFALGGLFAGVAFASLIGNGVARFFYGTGRSDDLYASAWSLIAVTAAVVMAVELLGALYHDRITSLASVFFDRLTAAFVGLVIGFLQIAFCCIVGLAVSASTDAPGVSLPGDRSSPGDSVRSSFIGGRVNSISGVIEGVFKPELPSNLPAHLADSTTRS